MRCAPALPYSGPPPAPRRPPLPPQSRPHHDIYLTDYLTDPALGWRAEPSGAGNSRSENATSFAAPADNNSDDLHRRRSSARQMKTRIWNLSQRATLPAVPTQ